MKKTIVPLIAALTILVFSIGTFLGQTPAPAPSVNLTQVGIIPVPIWTSSGATSASFDLDSFDPLTRTMYQADWRNHGALVIDTVTNSLQGIIKPPDCTGNNCPSGVLVIPDLRKLILTSRQTLLWIYDLKDPSSPPVELTGLPNGQDELDYDPIHQRIYVANTTAPFFELGIDLTGPMANTVVAQIPLPGAPEQPRYNPVDGLIYQTVPSVGGVVIDPDAGPAGTGAIVRTIAASDCGPQGNDIDVVTNVALWACTGGTTLKGAEVVNLTTGNVLAFWPYTQVIDVLHFNRNNRRWYAGSGLSTYTGNLAICPATTAAATVVPVLGIFAAPPLSSLTDVPTFVGVQCSGRSARVSAVDPIGNNVYLPTAQYPADPNTAAGQTGVLVFHDEAGAAQPTPERTQAVLGNNGTATFTLQGRAITAFASLRSLAHAPTRLVVTTTVGNEVVACAEAGGNATCNGPLIGDPLIGGVVLLGNNQKILSKGALVGKPPLVITRLALSASSVSIGSAFTATMEGSNLASQTYFDVRFRTPGSAAENAAFNWQIGPSGSHSVVTGTPQGVWTITGVRVHEDAADHSGPFVALSDSIAVR